jgi:hypothetical protein
LKELENSTEEKENPSQVDQKEAPYGHVFLCLQQWLFFSVIAALLPIVLNAIRAVGNGSALNVYRLIDHGELLLVCSAIAAEAIGDIFVSGKTKSFSRLFSFGTCCLFFFLSSGIFVIAESSPRSPDFIALSSLWVFVFTILAGGSCKVFAEV